MFAEVFLSAHCKLSGLLTAGLAAPTLERGIFSSWLAKSLNVSSSKPFIEEATSAAASNILSCSLPDELRINKM